MLKQLTELEIPAELWNVITEVTSASQGHGTHSGASRSRGSHRDICQQGTRECQELANILDKATLALRSLVQMIKLQIKGEAPGDVPSILGFKLPVSLDELFKIPRFFVAHFSPLAYLSSGDLPTLKELLVTYRPRLNPLDWVPPYKGRYPRYVGSPWVNRHLGSLGQGLAAGQDRTLIFQLDGPHTESDMSLALNREV
uniref:Uncharacterized protein n=1 Tax=Timema poppense TaxID=170557 RepID=A0A7R9DRT6_TIMPO|nr:unnamed protein product [Timema poppensis]